MKTVKLMGGASLALISVATWAAPVPEVYQAVRHDESRPMRDIIAEMQPSAPAGDESSPAVVPNIFLDKDGVRGVRLPEIDAAALGRGTQRAPTGTPAPSPTASFNGLNISQSGGSIPPDTQGDVSATQYIQWVNTRWAIFDKTTGAITSGPTVGNSFWSGFGGNCQNTNNGDPIALYDDHADRWVMSQFFVPSGNNGSQCVAISTTNDPLGTYYRYEFQFPLFGDYPHIGVWVDETKSQSAYLMVTHEFQRTPSQAFIGAAYIAMEREKMLQGLPAAIVRFPGFDAYGAEPAHLEGTVPVAASACPMFMHFDYSTGEYLFWDLCLNWTTPAQSTISENPTRIAPKNPYLPNFNLVSQPGTSSQLDVFGTHIMYRATTRAFPAGAPLPLTMVVNQTVETGGGAAGIRWTQFAFQPGEAGGGGDPDMVFGRGGFEDSDAPPARVLAKRIHDEGTYSPDTDVRWMGGIAIDRSGNIGLGYNRSSATTNPKIMVTGRALGDEPGTMRDEQFCSPTTTGSQTGLFSGRGRWGDYSSMSVDPADDCTFWHTNEYYPTTATSSWSTRICGFKFDSCGQPNFDVVVDSASRAEVCAVGGSDPTFAVRVGVLDGFTTSTTLSITGLPGGITPQFSPAVISPPGASTLTLQGATAVASGEYSGTITATAGAQTRTTGITLGVSSAVPAAPTLTAPANGATGIKVRPTLTWSAVAGALTYDVEVATSNTFGATVVASASVTGTSWPVSVGLDASTQYFWRVTPNNYCGSTPSAVFTFTTGVPGTCPSGTTSTTLFQDDVQSGTNGWTAAGTGGTAWSIVTGGAPGITTSAWRVPNNTVTSDRTLTSPNVVVPAGAAAVILSFDAYHNFETDPPAGCWDAASLEAKTASEGSFTYLEPTKIFTNGYNGTITAGSPLAGRVAWCYQPTDNTAQRTIVDLDNYAGQTIQLRFRHTSDSNTSATAPNGMWIDNIKVEACQ